MWFISCLKLSVIRMLLWDSCDVRKFLIKQMSWNLSFCGSVFSIDVQLHKLCFVRSRAGKRLVKISKLIVFIRLELDFLSSSSVYSASIFSSTCLMILVAKTHSCSFLYAVHQNMPSGQRASSPHLGSHQHGEGPFWQGNVCHRSCGQPQDLQPTFTTSSQKKGSHG